MSDCNDTGPCKHTSKCRIDAKNKDKISGSKSAACESSHFESQKVCTDESCKAAKYGYFPKHERSLLELPHMFRILGNKHFEIMRAYVPSLAVYGLTCAIALPLFCDWKLILQYLPIYNTRYRTKDE